MTQRILKKYKYKYLKILFKYYFMDPLEVLAIGGYASNDILARGADADRTRSIGDRILRIAAPVVERFNLFATPL